MNESTEYLRHVLTELESISPSLSFTRPEQERDEARSRIDMLIGSMRYNIESLEQNQNH